MNNENSQKISDLLENACLDVLPEESSIETDAPADALELALPTNKLWDCGQVLDFHFLNGTDTQKSTFRNDAAKWSTAANLVMRFDAPLENSEFRVSFGKQGNWSFVGKDNLGRPTGSTTMAIQNITSIQHEVGHAIGCIHEHSSPTSTIQWNKPVVYQALGGPPNNWNAAKVDHNVFAKYAATQTQFSEFDQNSIMLYFFPASWTLNGVGTHANSVLSDTDKAFINRCYPGCTVDFSKALTATGGCTVKTGPRTFFNQQYGNSWLMNQPNASFIEVSFNQPKQYQGNDIYSTAILRMSHLTSMNGPKAGNSPVDIIVNGNILKENYSPPSGNYLTDKWDILQYMNDGANTVRINFKSAQTNYWIKNMQVDLSRLLN